MWLGNQRHPWGSSYSDLVLYMWFSANTCFKIWLKTPFSSNAEDDEKKGTSSKEKTNHEKEPLIKNPVLLPESLQIVPNDLTTSGDLAGAQAALRKKLEEVGLLVASGLVCMSYTPQNQWWNFKESFESLIMAFRNHDHPWACSNS